MTFRLARVLIGVPLLASMALLSPASAQAPAAPLSGHMNSPSKLDYLVLASLADSSNLLALSTYRAPPRTVSAPPEESPAQLGEDYSSAD